MTEIVQAQPASPRPPASRTAQLRQVAQDLEASFLAEMLRHAGAGNARGSFGGGVGEEQFSSFLRNEQVRAMAQGGGIGLAESLFQALVAREGGAS